MGRKIQAILQEEFVLLEPMSKNKDQASRKFVGVMIEALPSRGVGAGGGEAIKDLQQSRWFLGPLN